jgi:hypothetical protein
MTTSPSPFGNKAAGAIAAPTPGIVVRRQPLGLPAGSVRALLTFMILGLIWALLLLPEEKNVRVPLYLYYLMFLVLGHFYAAHGQSIAGPETGPASPLHLPRGTLRTLIILGFVAVFGYRYYVYRNFEELFKVREQPLQQPYLPLIILAGFFVGVFLNRVVLRLIGIRPWYQDILAWVALLATLGLSAEVIMQLIINPSVEPAQQLHLYQWHLVLSAIISFYFGLRS